MVKKLKKQKQKKQKKLHKFLIFDIMSFYLLIKKKIVLWSNMFWKIHVNISQKDNEFTFHSRKSLLYNSGIHWGEKLRHTFDVTKGAYDGAEICELNRKNLERNLIEKKYDSKDIKL